jgi:galacturan 1,4-alpha-galacturonidase
VVLAVSCFIPYYSTSLCLESLNITSSNPRNNTTNRDIPVASDLFFESMHAESLRGPAFAISQCTTFSGAAGNCSSSEFQLYDITFQSVTGTTTSNDVASFQCSAVKPCESISILDEHLVLTNGSTADAYLCYEVEKPIGWECTGDSCVGGSASGNC